MTRSEQPEFLSGLLDFLAARRFFPEITSTGNQFEFSVVDRTNVEYFCTGRLTPADGALTSYEIRRDLCSYAGFPRMESLLHFLRFFGLINQPFAILLHPNGQLVLSCAAIHQTKTFFDFEALAYQFKFNAACIASAMERLSSRDWSHEEIEGMVYLLSGVIKQEIPDAG